MEILVTIAIPIYNAELYLRDAIQSCINQTYKNWELLLICDGSTDNSTSIAIEMAKHDNRIKVMDDNKNRGLISRLNESILLARGQYYARMDADDIMYVTRIEEQVNYFKEHPNADVVGTSIMTIDNNNKIIGSGLCEGNVKGFVHPTVMGKTEWFRANPYAEWALRVEDKELWYRTSSKSNFHAIGKPLLFYREFGMPTVYKYIQSQITFFKIIYRYNIYEKKISWVIKKSTLTLVKILIYIVFSFIGKVDFLIGKRKRIIIPSEKRLNDLDLRQSIKAE